MYERPRGRNGAKEPGVNQGTLWDDVGMVSNGDDCSQAVRLKYYPYGQEVGTVTANDRAKGSA